MTSVNEQRVNLIRGVWFVDIPEGCNGGLLLKKRVPPPPETGQNPGFLTSYGFTIEFQKNDRLIDRYSAPCGMDPNIHSWSGKWELDVEQNLLSMKIDNIEFSGIMTDQPSIPSEDYKNGREYKIMELTEQKMLLERVQSPV
ncbi:MAG TPA: hypothetical protein VN687_01235 [Blastocatellia bacterium]|nr:hypothetical protein [Blastocatellia bacterium]